jgi:hypothetical protein
MLDTRIPEDFHGTQGGAICGESLDFFKKSQWDLWVPEFHSPTKTYINIYHISLKVHMSLKSLKVETHLQSIRAQRFT